MISPRTPALKTPEQRAKFLRSWMADRERGRKDLLWLCREVLGYKDVTGATEDAENHQPLIDGLHKFEGRIEVADPEAFRIVSSKPRVPMYDQRDPGTLRNRLFLYPRDHLKTTVITLAHTIQWIINYEDIRVLLSTATGVQADGLMDALLSHFRYNADFRFLYPEFCPSVKSAADFGSKQQFTVPNRTQTWIKEPTVMAITIGKIIAGTHQDVHKHSDLVDKENVKTVNQIKEVNDHYAYTDPLLARISSRQGWRDVEGTRYDFSDLGGTILDAEEKLEPHKKTFIVVERSAEADPKNKKTLWPARYNWDALMAIKSNPAVGLYIYEAQYNQRCIPPTGGLAARSDVKFISREKVRQLMPYYRIHTTIDLAGMEEQSTGAHSVLTTAGFLRDGRMHVIDVRLGHLTPFEVIQAFFDINKKYHPVDFKMEKNHHAQVLMPFLKQEMQRTGVFMNVLNLPRDTSISKDNRISGLQSWFKTHRIWIVDDLPCDAHILLEIARFPKFKYKDFLDTLADQLQNAGGKDIEPDVYPGLADPAVKPWWQESTQPKFIGFDPITKDGRWAGDSDDVSLYYHPRTGL